MKKYLEKYNTYQVFLKSEKERTGTKEYGNNMHQDKLKKIALATALTVREET